MPYTTRQMARQRRERIQPPSEPGAHSFSGGDQPEGPDDRHLTGPDADKARRAIAPLVAGAGIDLGASVIHQIATTVPSSGAGCVAAFTVCCAAGFVASLRRHDERHQAAGLAAGAWIIVAVILLSFVHGLGDVILDAIPIAGAYIYRHMTRPAPEPEPAPSQPAAIEPAPEPDPEPQVVKDLREVLCTSGTFAGMEIYGYRLLGDQGDYLLKVLMPLTGAGTVTNLRKPSTIEQIAKVLETSPGNIAVEYDPDYDRRSERRGQINYRHERPKRTSSTTRLSDPRVSTFDPSTGAFEIGDFSDGAPGHWQVYMPPRGGAKGGLISGVSGTGKTGAAHNILSQCGLMTDPQTGRRLCAIITCDPQHGMSFSGWHTRSTASFAGPRACLRGLQMATAITNARAMALGKMQRTDALGRLHVGQGFWPLSPDWPLVAVLLDELPKLLSDLTKPDVDAVKACLSTLIREARKTGVFLIPITQTPNLDMVGGHEIRETLRTWNVLGFRSDQSSAGMIGLTVDPFYLGDEIGLAYLAGIDQRNSSPVTTRWLEEDASDDNLARIAAGLEPLADLREVADLIASMDIHLDEPFLEAASSLGFKGPGWVLTDDDIIAEELADETAARTFWDDILGQAAPRPAASMPAATTITPAGLIVPATAAAGARLTPVPSPSPAVVAFPPVQDVVDVLMTRPSASLNELLLATGKSLAELTAATGVLLAHDQVTKGADGRYSIRRPA